VIVLATLGVTRHAFTTLQTKPSRRGYASLTGWDAAWYRDIARHGYDFTHAREGLRFFPLFPLVGHAVAWLPGVGAATAVVVVANAAAFALGFVLYALVVQERHDEVLARRAVYLVYLLPPAFVLVMGYAEALFMTATVIGLMTLRARRWWVAALAGLVAGLTRPVGILLAVPALVEVIRTRDRSPGAIAAVIAPAAGAFAYLAWAARRTHDFFYPIRVQQDPAKRGHWVDPVRAVAHAFNEAFTGDHLSAGVHAIAALVLVALLVVLYRRWPLSFAVYATVALVAALSSHNLDSLERYALATVPFVLAGADVMSTDNRERIVLTLSAAGLAIAAFLAFTGVMVP
jgi:hypothetical protein